MTIYIILGVMLIVIVFIAVLLGKAKAESKTNKHIIRSMNDRMVKKGETQRKKKDAELLNKQIKKGVSTVDIDKYADSVPNMPRRKPNKVSDG